MKKSIKIALAGIAMLGLVGCADVSGADTGATHYATGSCKLTNLQQNAVLYNGPCTIRQNDTASNTIYNIKLGSAQSFTFAGKGSSRYHGSQKVKYTDLGRGAIFVWDRFSLSVAAN